MRPLRTFILRLRAVLFKESLDRELDDELHSHLSFELNENLRRGMNPEEARRAALRKFGGLEQTKESYRDRRGLPLIESFLGDLRYGLRSLRRSPLFTVTAVLTLAFTTAAISTVFTLANTLLFRPLPVDHPEQIVVVSATRRHGAILSPVSYPDYLHFRDFNKTLVGLAAHYSTAPLFVTANDNSKEINGAVVSANFFPLLGIKPALGRFFRPDEDSVPDRDRVAVLGFELWRNWFGASTDAIGALIRINGVPFTVIGIAPNKFHGVNQNPSQIYIPMMMLRTGYRWCDDSLAEDCTTLDMMGRLARGHTVQEARAEMAALMPARWASATEANNTGVTVVQERGADRSSDGIRFVKLLFLVSGVLLIVCCANLAGLLIARGSARSREFAIRISLGAARVRLARQVITESLLVSLGGGVLGAMLSLFLTSVLKAGFYSWDSEGHPLYFDFSISPGVILAVLGVSVAAGFSFGIVPSIKSSSVSPGDCLKSEALNVTSRSQFGRWLVGAQAAFAVALVAVASLLIASTRILAQGNNFESSHVALMRLRPRLIKYSPDQAQRFQRLVIGRLEALPGVESVSMVGTGSVIWGSSNTVSLPEWPDGASRAIPAGYIEIGPRYFETLRTPVLRGREFDEHDSLLAPQVAVVNRTLALRLWPAGNPLGATVVVGRRTYQVVGVVADVPLQNRTEAPRPYVYVPFWQIAGEVDARYCVRVRGDPAAMLPVLTREVNRVDTDVPVAEILTLPLQMAGDFQPLRMSATFLAYAAGLAVLLSALGLYGALAFAVSRRTKEIGIRMALGAEPTAVLSMIVREGMAVIVPGILTGLGLGVVGSRLVRHLLFGSAGGDAYFYAAASTVVACTGLFACWLPARRASRVDPMVALRNE